jgi:hypothetical protein
MQFLGVSLMNLCNLRMSLILSADYTDFHRLMEVTGNNIPVLHSLNVGLSEANPGKYFQFRRLINMAYNCLIL